MKRAGIMAIAFAAVAALYLIAGHFYRGTWRPAAQLETRRTYAAKVDPNEISNYPIQIEHGLPTPCLAHNQIMACLDNVAVTTDVLGFHVVANLEKVVLPVSSIIGSNGLVYVQGLLTIQANSDDAKASVTLTYDQQDANGQIGASAQLGADGTITSQSEGTSDGIYNGTYSVTIANQSYSGKFGLDSYNATLTNLSKFCAEPLSILVTSQVEFPNRSFTDPDIDARYTLQSTVSLPVRVQNCPALNDGLSQPLLANPWKNILAAFEKSDTSIALGFGGSNPNDWLELLITLKGATQANGSDITSGTVVWQSTVNPDPENVVNGTALVEYFWGQALRETVGILGIKGIFPEPMPEDEMIALGLEEYKNKVTFAGCKFTLGRYHLHVCGTWPPPIHQE